MTRRSVRLFFTLIVVGWSIPHDHIVKADDTSVDIPDDKRIAIQSVIDREAEAWEKALSIWKWAEPGYQEIRSSKLLAGWLEANGFEVTRVVAGIPTAFVASFGDQPPVIGILGEFDALPGLSQTAAPERQPIEGQSYGQGCGHHLFGAASASAAIAIAEQIKAGKLKGTVRFYGCPAEEGGSGKVFMVRARLFDDCAAVLHWHPSHVNAVGDRSTMARMAVRFRFRGTAAHASMSPDQGRSALDAVELTNFAVQLLREHVPEMTRIHYVITDGGRAPNVVPERAEVYYYVRHPESEKLISTYRRVLRCAQAAALATETELEVNYEGGIVELLPNEILTNVTRVNLRQLNDMHYDDDELKFALKIQETLDEKPPITQFEQVIDLNGEIGRGSTDVGDVSWVVPTAGFNTACWVAGTSPHSWQAVAAGGMSIGKKGMQLAAKVLAASAWDMLTHPELIDQAQAELKGRLGKRAYQTLMQADQRPPLDYRKNSIDSGMDPN
ncbi:MAG: amidohydrolase [Planctomycetota bacterium]|nr:amidohydrolase [Planctomycetota bacterium]MDA1212452.1 amidohydrolase [Planctomycetota bacterium]